MKKLFTLSTCLFLAACGDDEGKNNPDAAPQPDAPTQVDAPSADAPIDAPPTWTQPAAHSFQWSAAGPDRAYSVAVDSQNRFYVAGYAAQTLTGDKKVVVTRLLTNGMPDSTFGTGGTFDTGVVFKGADDEIDIARVGNTDTFVISATVAAATANPDDTADTDIGLIKLKLNANGGPELDTAFGGGDGIAIHSLNTSALNTANPPAAVGRDQVRAVAAQSTGAIYIHAAARANGNVQGGSTARLDTDFVVAKFTADGTAFDTNFSQDGKFELDLYNNAEQAHSGATPRAIAVLDGGAVLAGGYANAGLTEGPQAVLFRLTNTGALDTNFASSSTIQGLFHSTVLGVQTEVYNFARHEDNGTTYVVTGGYGRDSGTINDWISLRFNATTGERDTAWGGASFSDGKVLFDPTPTNTASGSNCRNAISLPGNKTLLLGSSNRDATTNNMQQNQDAAFAILTENGALDTAYGTGIATYMLGNDGQDAFWGGAANSTHALIVGWRGAVGTASETNNDDAYAVLLELE